MLFYGLEACTKRLVSFGKYLEESTNIEVMWKLRKKKEHFTVKAQKLQYFGHIQVYRLLVVQGKMGSKRAAGRWGHSWLHNLSQWFGLSSDSLFWNATNEIKNSLVNSQRPQRTRQWKIKNGLTCEDSSKRSLSSKFHLAGLYLLRF